MATAFKIENDVPAPDFRGRGRPPLYPFADMKPGQSFLIRKAKAANFKSAQIAASAHGRRHRCKFITRQTPDGLRIWRIA